VTPAPDGAPEIIDSHTHAFPYLGGASGFRSVREHMRYLQKDMCYSSQPIRRLVDGVAVTGQSLWDGRDPGPDGLFDVNFRVGDFGRLEWTRDGVDYYLQFQPASLRGMVSPPELLLAHMNEVGVGRAVLYNAHLYGKLNEFFADAVARYPDRFIGTAEVDETQAHTDAEIDRLRTAVRTHGLRGIYYVIEGLFPNAFRDHTDDRRFDPFWDEVRRLDIAACWEIHPYPFPTREDYLEQLRRFGRWRARYPEIRTILVPGLGSRLIGEGGYDLPEDIIEICRGPNLWLELLYPIGMGGVVEYPLEPARRLVLQLYELFGPSKLIWGSDLPNVERYCTYRQSLEYLRGATFIPPEDMAQMLGGNAARLYALEDRTLSPQRVAA
jgi:predicted TIM-barrel fold metal-dependent hydrolase